MRALKLMGMTFVFAIMLFNSQTAQAQAPGSASGTYQLGVYSVDGVGDTPAEAISIANGELWDTMAAIQALLPPNYNVTGYEIVIEGFIDPTFYTIEFMVNIEWFEPLPAIPNK